jgi:hypothetical protein
METIQLAIANGTYATTLRELLARNAGWNALIVESPNTRAEGVIVLDTGALESLPSGLPNPERVVLITQNQPQLLARAWEAGIVSVVFENDPMDTALLAIMAARLKVGKTARQEAAGSQAGQGAKTGRGNQ